jgi:hypothetical protein
MYAECGYIHEIRDVLMPRLNGDGTYRPFSEATEMLPVSNLKLGLSWRGQYDKEHCGNAYPTHGIGSIAQILGVNRGDRFDYLVSLESDPSHLATYAAAHFPPDSWKNKVKPVMGDVNTTLIRTANGKSITVVHDVSSPRPYSRINFVSGTKGCFWGYPSRPKRGTQNFEVGFEEANGAGVHTFFPREKAEEVRVKYRHPLWKKVGEVAKKVGGHGGMDFIMDLRWVYCLRNGLPLDQDVYDLAAWCSICELSDRSVRNRSAAIDVPDFTRGAWRTAAPLPEFDFDMTKLKLV